ncbi:mannose-6-phosphate isomerase-like protein (cupin superfamily) [Paenarthrobacter nitroguajacolicus]|uniref:cupin domain-containing protein n=1 Tax=Paenarthrobacter TaxID=1742992 RepID=UPI00286051E4|nr:cupin domain-containing protein [Paenarthrobacter nitroguajacolicus]MDR6986036.1 mannose-6-phosphate isomerase-like protein (cupin superfamily) [Paenarthrobacter nitroguajacolicus]
MCTSFPGATAVSEVSIYDWPDADGTAGGSPHLHTASTEAYVVQQGTGRLETLDSRGFTSTALAPGTVVWFTPGTIHRAINDSGDLRVLVVMQNAGLPENGDAVMTFPPEHLVDPAAYARAAALPSKNADGGDVAAEAAARRRRDLAVEGYLALKAAVQASGVSALADFHASAARLVNGKTETWRGYLAAGAERQAGVTDQQLTSLESMESFYMQDARTTMGERKTRRIYGMCGRIQAWELSETANVGL